MEPIEIAISLELGSLLLAAVGGLGAWIHHCHQKALHRQRERHHGAMLAHQERAHREQLAALNGTGSANGTNSRAPRPAMKDEVETAAA